MARTRKPRKLKPKQLVRRWLEEAMAETPRIAPRCAHFGVCGGCAYQDIPHDAQVAAKRATLDRILEHAGIAELFAGVPVEVLPSPKPFAYRQRMDYVHAFGKAGLRERGSHKWVCDLTECHLLPAGGFEAFARATEWIRAREIPPYNYLKHEGELRYVVVRQARSGAQLLSLVTKSRGRAEDVAAIAESLLTEGHAQSVHWLLQEGLADLSFGEPVASWGAPTITETLLGMRFAIGPNTFFQSNADVAEAAFARIQADARAAAPANALDLFSGTGVIALLLAGAARHVTAVESVADNEDLARVNLSVNGVTNLTYHREEVTDFLKRLAQQCETDAAASAYDYIVVDPPRAGIGEKALRPLLAAGAPRLVYMSCNPLTFASDLKVLAEAYMVESATLLDMFPQTPHFEMLAFLRLH